LPKPQRAGRREATRAAGGVKIEREFFAGFHFEISSKWLFSMCFLRL